MRIITSNIRFANPGDGQHDWPNRLPHLKDIFESFAPDILGTQEGRRDQLMELDRNLPNLELVASHRTWISERMYPCLFINPKTIFVEKSGDIWLSETPSIPGSFSFESAFPRLCTWAEITIKASGLNLMVVNTHLDHILSNTRICQVEVLINEVKKISNLPIIIMGDFNESPFTMLQTKLREAFFLKDPWIEKKQAEETSHHSFLGTKNLDGDRIDWILIPENFECTMITLDKKSFTKGIYPSDHYPILATFIPK